MKLINKSNLLLAGIMLAMLSYAYASDESIRTLSIVDNGSIINPDHSGYDTIKLQCDSVVDALTGEQIPCGNSVSSTWDDANHSLFVTFNSDHYNRPSEKGIYKDGFKCHVHENNFYGFSGAGTPWSNPTDFTTNASYDVTDKIVYNYDGENPANGAVKYVGGCIPIWLSGKLILTSETNPSTQAVEIPIYLGYGYSTLSEIVDGGGAEDGKYVKSHYAWFITSDYFLRQKNTTNVEIAHGDKIIGPLAGKRINSGGELQDYHVFYVGE